MAGKGGAEIQYPSSSLVKYMNILAAGLGIISVALDAAVPVAQQLGKQKQARSGLERAIALTVLFTLIRTVPRLYSQMRKLRTQLAAPVAE